MAIVFPTEPTRIGVSIAVSAVPLSHVVETSRLAHHIRRMSRKEPKRSDGSDQNKAIARWDNEGGAPKGAPQEDRNELAPLTNHRLRLLAFPMRTGGGCRTVDRANKRLMHCTNFDKK